LFYTCASALGAQVIFPDDASPQVVGRAIDDLADIKKLRVPKDVERAGIIPDVIRRYEHLRRKAATTGVSPVFSLPAQSPLGTAVVLRGTKLFSDLVTNPSAVRALLEIITETAIRILRFQEAFTGNQLAVVGMDDDYGGLVSPEHHEEFGFPYMKRLYDAFETPARYLHSETLSRAHLRLVRSLGITHYDAWPYHGLSVADVRAELPDTFFTWNCWTAGDLLRDTPRRVTKRYRQAVAAGAPGMILCLCARGVPRENILAFVEAARELASASDSTGE
jgi:uroporphyrinogen-III decarboxylase